MKVQRNPLCFLFPGMTNGDRLSYTSCLPQCTTAPTVIPASIISPNHIWTGNRQGSLHSYFAKAYSSDYHYSHQVATEFYRKAPVSDRRVMEARQLNTASGEYCAHPFKFERLRMQRCAAAICEKASFFPQGTAHCVWSFQSFLVQEQSIMPSHILLPACSQKCQAYSNQTVTSCILQNKEQQVFGRTLASHLSGLPAHITMCMAACKILCSWREEKK